MERVNSQTFFDLEYFFEISPDLLCIYGFDGYFKKINPAVSKTLGYNNTELFSSRVSSFVHPEDLLLSNHKMETLINGQSLLNFENRYLHKDGSVVWLTWTSVPIKKDEPIFASAKDITYKTHLEEYGRLSSALGMISEDH